MSLRHEFANTPGGLILRLLQNRNLDTTAAAYYLGGLGGRPMYSSSTIYRIAIGSKARTPDLLAGFSTVLDLTSADLAALTGVDPSAASVQVRSEAEGAADLIWSPGG